MVDNLSTSSTFDLLNNNINNNNDLHNNDAINFSSHQQQFLHGKVEAASSPMPDWLANHPFADDQEEATLFTIPAILYAVVTTSLIVILSLFWQLQR